jgi:hypothetical protein
VGRENEEQKSNKEQLQEANNIILRLNESELCGSCRRSGV